MGNFIDTKRIKKHWGRLIDQSEYAGNRERLSVDMGLSPSYMRGHLVNDSLPKMDVIAALACCLGCTPNDLFDLSYKPLPDAKILGETISREVFRAVNESLRKAASRPTGNDVMRWWAENGGRLESYSSFDGMFDLYEAPDSEHRRIVPNRLGQGSLATRSLGAGSPELLAKTIAPLGQDFTEHILIAHQSSIDGGPIMTMETLDAAHPTENRQIKIEYLRTLAPVTLPDGRTCVLNYSELVAEP